MELYTIQLAQWRIAQRRNIPIVDTTVKSGSQAFCPEWDMVMGIKDGSLSEQAYRAQYVALMRRTWRTHRREWEDLLAMPVVALGCYCKTGTFCHRHILKEAVSLIQKQRGALLVDGGEITKPA